MPKTTLQYDDKNLELPVTVGSENEGGIDISKLRGATGLVTIDPGFVNTASCKSAITFLDGEKGILRYRGYPIEELAEKSSFLEVAYLLIYGELPRRRAVRAVLAHHHAPHAAPRGPEEPSSTGFPRDAHPMAILASTVSTGAVDLLPGLQRPADPHDVEVSTFRLLAKLPTIAAWSYKRSKNQPFIYPTTLSYAANFLQMMFGYPYARATRSTPRSRRRSTCC
jgi:citrate synthase